MRKCLILAAALLVSAGSAGVAGAQYIHGPYGGYTYAGPQLPPPTWSYDPYTNGTTACPQWDRHDPASCTSLVPSYGQPSFSPWMTRY